MRISKARQAVFTVTISLALAAPGLAHAITIEGLSIGGTQNDGSGDGYTDGESTSGLITDDDGNQVINTAYLATGTPSTSPTLLNSSAVSSIGYAMTVPGAYTFTAYLPGSAGSSYQSLNLFFGNDTQPGISAYTLVDDSFFAADGSDNLIPLSLDINDDPNTVTGSGSLSYDDSVDTATLTALAIASSFAGESLGWQNAGDADTNNYEVATFTLNVTSDSPSSVPEPASIELIGLGVLCLATLRRATRRTS